MNRLRNIILTLFGAIMLIAMFPPAVNAQLIDAAKDRRAEIREIRRQDSIAYINACKAGTLAAFKNYLKEYPNGLFKKQMNDRIADFDIWSKAKQANTIEAYNEYLNQSVTKAFIIEAGDAITELESVDAWNAIKTTGTLQQVKAFIASYPKSSRRAAAVKRAHELQGVEYYQKGEWLMALAEFKEAGGRNSLEYKYQKMYDYCLEYDEYRKLDEYTPESTLIAYLNRHPNGYFHNNVSNEIAVRRAKELDKYSTSVDYENAMAFAKDYRTQREVQTYIDRSKADAEAYRKMRKKWERDENGGWTDFVLGCDFTGNVGASDEGQKMCFDFIVGLRIGNYRDPLQFEVGLKPGFVMPGYVSSYYDYYYDYYTDSETYFHMPIYGKLKINVCNAGRGKFFIFGEFDYNAVRDDWYESEMSVGGGIGLGWKHFDMAFYYQNDIDYIDPHSLGVSMGVYF